MKRSCTRSLVRVTCLASVMTFGASLACADPDPTGTGFQGVPDEIQTRTPPPPPDNLTGTGKHYAPPPTSKKSGGSVLTTNQVIDINLLDVLLLAWQTQIRFLIQH